MIRPFSHDSPSFVNYLQTFPLLCVELVVVQANQNFREEELILYFYRSPIGLMQIYFDQATRKYALKIGDIVYELHESAQSAADNVYVHVTGCYEWDRLDGEASGPTDLSEWDYRP